MRVISSENSTKASECVCVCVCVYKHCSRSFSLLSPQCKSKQLREEIQDEGPFLLSGEKEKKMEVSTTVHQFD